MKKVDFIIGGAQKCGTSALARYIAQHPDIYIPEGEMHYFDRRINRHGIQWYLEQFKVGGDRVVGEKTPAYIRYPRVPDAIKAYFPHVRLIFILRDPVNRAYSHYWHLRRQSLEFRSFEDAIEKPFWFGIVKSPGYIERGMYAKQLKPWYQVFDKSQILVVKAEDLKSDTKKVLNSVFDHLGVNSEVRVDTPPIHPGVVPRSWFHYAALFPVNCIRRINNYRFGSLQVLLTNIHQYVLKYGKSGYAQMQPQTRLKLQSIFASRNEELRNLTGIGWDY